MRRLLLAVVAAAVVAGMFVFEPWTLWTRSTIDEAIPVVAVTARPATTQPSATSPAETPEASPAAEDVEPVVLATGRFVTQEHGTSGRARLLLLADGSRIVRLEGFSTSNGPDLHVWLSDRTAGGSWFKYDEGRSVGLGELKATDGNQNYAVPDDVDLDGLRSVVIWCKRFSVAFGSAPLDL